MLSREGCGLWVGGCGGHPGLIMVEAGLSRKSGQGRAGGREEGRGEGYRKERDGGRVEGRSEGVI